MIQKTSQMRALERKEIAERCIKKGVSIQTMCVILDTSKEDLTEWVRLNLPDMKAAFDALRGKKTGASSSRVDGRRRPRKPRGQKASSGVSTFCATPMEETLTQLIQGDLRLSADERPLFKLEADDQARVQTAAEEFLEFRERGAVRIAKRY